MSRRSVRASVLDFAEDPDFTGKFVDFIEKIKRETGRYPTLRLSKDCSLPVKTPRGYTNVVFRDDREFLIEEIMTGKKEAFNIKAKPLPISTATSPIVIMPKGHILKHDMYLEYEFSGIGPDMTAPPKSSGSIVSELKQIIELRKKEAII